MKNNIFTKNQLQEMWSRTPERQLAVMQAKILEAFSLTNGEIAVSYSGGKDSSFMLYIIAQLWVSVYDKKPLRVVFCDTTNEFIETYKFIPFFLQWVENETKVIIDYHKTRPIEGITFVSLARKALPLISKDVSMKVRKMKKYLKQSGVEFEKIKEYHKYADNESRDKLIALGLSKTVVLMLTGWVSSHKCYSRRFMLPYRWAPLLNKNCPVDISEQCCNELKKKPARGIDKACGGGGYFVGEMACDSKQREDGYLKTGCNSFNKGKGKSKPMGGMTEQVMFFYYSYYKLPLNPYYGKLTKEKSYFCCTKHNNGGCALCGFGIDKDPTRFEKLKSEDYPKFKLAFTPLEKGGLGYKEACEYLNKFCKCKIIIPTLTAPQPLEVKE